MQVHYHLVAKILSNTGSLNIQSVGLENHHVLGWTKYAHLEYMLLTKQQNASDIWFKTDHGELQGYVNRAL